MGILKRALRRKRLAADVYYLNVRFAKKIDINVYEELSEIPFAGEWVFSQHLFGHHGSGELKNAIAEIGRRSEAYKHLTGNARINFSHLSRYVIPVFLKECLSQIPWERYRVIAFTSVFWQQIASLLLAKKIKSRYPDVKIVFGGPNVHGDMGVAALEAFDWIDYVVDGEGEEVFPALVSNILKDNPYEPIPGVSFRNRDRIHIHQGLPPLIRMNRSPVPDYSEYFEEVESLKLADQIPISLPVETSRGCWWGERSHCTFCGLNPELMRYRYKSPRRVLREMLTQARKYKVLFIETVDFILEMSYFTDLFPLLKRENLDLEIFYFVKSNLNLKQVEMLAEAGVETIQPGIESLDTEVLKLMRKGVTAIQNIQLLKWCLENGINVHWNLLYGLPGEKKRHYENMLQTCLLISHFQPPMTVSRAHLQRYSPYYRAPEEFGIHKIRPDRRYNFIYPEGKMNLEKAAYHFEFQHDYEDDPELYSRPIQNFVDTWRRSFFGDGIHFRSRRGPGFLELMDNRLFSQQKERRTVLSGIDADIYSYCSGIRTFREIHAYALSVQASNWSEARTKMILNDLVGRKFMFAEGQKYLSLATGLPHQPETACN